MLKSHPANKSINNSIEKLKSENLLLKQLTESITDIFYALDNELRCTYWNKATEEFTGILSKDAIGRTIDEIFPNNPEIKVTFELYPKVLETKKTKSIQSAFTHNKKRSVFQVYAYPTHNGISVLLKDITKKKLAEEKLKKSEKRLTDFMDSAYDSLYLLDSKLNFIEINKKAVEFLGKKKEDIIGKNIVEIVPDVISSGRYEKHLEVLRTGNPYIIEDFIPHPVFAGKHFILKSFKVGDGLGVLAYDITEHKIAELELLQAKEKVEESERKFRLAFEFAAFGMAIVNPKMQFISVNPTFCIMLGYTEEELKQKTFNDITHPDDIKLGMDLVNEMYTGKRDYFWLEKRYLHKNGRVVWGLLSSSVVRGSNNKPLFTFAQIQNITEKKKAEEQLVEFSQRLKIAVTSGQLGIWDWNVKENIMVWDERMFELYGIKSDSFTNTIEAWTNGLHPEDRQRAIDECYAALDGEKEFNSTFRVLHPDGKILQIRAHSLITRDFEGKPLRMIGINRDITQSKLSEEQLLIAKEKAEESDRLKTAFLQNMSHEIRTPLNAIMGFSSLLKPNFNNKEKLEYFSTIIEKRGSDLLQIIDGILDVAKIEAGHLPLHLEKFRLGNLFSELNTLFSEYQERINKTQIKFEIDPSCLNSNLSIITDQVKLNQIFTNLINNAFKFTSEGKIYIGCKKIDSETIEFYVSDTGIGIPKDKHSEIFIRFKQASQDITLQYGGSGIGLTIVQGLLKLLKGKIWLESEPGKGSTFYFSIPLEIAGTLTDKTQESYFAKQLPKANATILVVEDDKFNAEYLKEILKSTHYTILITDLGLKAVDIALTQIIDMILMDIRLPDIQGYDAIRLIKNKKPNLTIIAQTAYATSTDRMRALEAGCDDYISKPVKRADLISMINKYLSPK